jgi:hypothetical protein
MPLNPSVPSRTLLPRLDACQSQGRRRSALSFDGPALTKDRAGDASILMNIQALCQAPALPLPKRSIRATLGIGLEV